MVDHDGLGGMAGDSPRFVSFGDCNRTQRAMLDKFEDVGKQMEKMQTSLFGVDGTAQSGILSIIHGNQVRILQLETQIKVWVGIGGFIGSLVGSILVSIIMWKLRGV